MLQATTHSFISTVSNYGFYQAFCKKYLSQVLNPKHLTVNSLSLGIVQSICMNLPFGSKESKFHAASALALATFGHIALKTMTPQVSLCCFLFYAINVSCLSKTYGVYSNQNIAIRNEATIYELFTFSKFDMEEVFKKIETIVKLPFCLIGCLFSHTPISLLFYPCSLAIYTTGSILALPVEMIRKIFFSSQHRSWDEIFPKENCAYPEAETYIQIKQQMAKIPPENSKFRQIALHLATSNGADVLFNPYDGYLKTSSLKQVLENDETPEGTLLIIVHVDDPTTKQKFGHNGIEEYFKEAQNLQTDGGLLAKFIEKKHKFFLIENQANLPYHLEKLIFSGR